MTASTLKKAHFQPDEDSFSSRHSTLLSQYCSRSHSFRPKTPQVSTFKNGSSSFQPKPTPRRSLKPLPLQIPIDDQESTVDYFHLPPRAFSPCSSISSSFHKPKSIAVGKTHRPPLLKKSGTQPHLGNSLYKKKKKGLSQSSFKSPGITFTHPESLPRLESPMRYGKYLIRMFDGEFNETQSERELKRLHLELLANRLDLSSESSFQGSSPLKRQKSRKRVIARGATETKMEPKCAKEDSKQVKVSKMRPRGKSTNAKILASHIEQKEKEIPPEAMLDRFIEKAKANVDKVNSRRQNLHLKFRERLASTASNPTPRLETEQDEIAALRTLDSLPRAHPSQCTLLLAQALPDLQSVFNLKHKKPLAKARRQLRSLATLRGKSPQESTISTLKDSDSDSHFESPATARSRVAPLSLFGQSSGTMNGMSAIHSARANKQPYFFSKQRHLERAIQGPFSSKFLNNFEGYLDTDYGCSQQITTFGSQTGSTLTSARRVPPTTALYLKRKNNWFTGCRESTLDSHRVLLPKKNQKMSPMASNLQKALTNQAKVALILEDQKGRAPSSERRDLSRGTRSRQVSTDVETIESVKRKNENLKTVPFLQRIQSSYV